MPTFKNVTVSIHCPNTPPDSLESFNWAAVEHGPAGEYGTHKLRNTPKITSYIPAVSNCPFAISITILDSYEPKVKGDDRESLAAYVYFDGKTKEETATLLRRGVETWISSRWIEVSEGNLAEREFVFREVGLENFLSTLDISKEKKAESETLTLARRHSMPAKMDPEDEEGEVKSIKPRESAGQIRVDLFRVRCEGPVRRGVWGGMFKENGNKDAMDGDVGGDVDVSHTAGFSEPKPLDRETVSTQSVSHLDAEGVVYASFTFFYRGSHQLKKMGLMKPPTLPARTLSTNTTPAKTKQDFASLSSPSELIPKGPDLSKKINGFSDFRDPSEPLDSENTNINGLFTDEPLESLNGDDLNRDMRDNEREQMKSEDEVRMEDELAAEVSKIRLKRSHSTTSLNDKAGNPTTPPPSGDQLKPPKFTTPGGPSSNGSVSKKTEPETPAKKRRGSNDVDVKSPQAGPVRSVGFGADLENTPAFGGLLGQSSSAMDEEEEL